MTWSVICLADKKIPKPLCFGFGHAFVTKILRKLIDSITLPPGISKVKLCISIIYMSIEIPVDTTAVPIWSEQPHYKHYSID
jgi:hypothetical protein